MRLFSTMVWIWVSQWQMGLGKTLQAISFLSYLKVHRMSHGPFCELRKPVVWLIKFECFEISVTDLHWHFFFGVVFVVVAVVLCPLSVTDGWVSEMAKFTPKLKVLRYVGDKEHRRNLRKALYEHVKEHPSSTDVSFGTLPSSHGFSFLFLCFNLKFSLFSTI